MSQLGLFLFGDPRLEQDGQTVELKSRKGLALLAYLAASGPSATRDMLATLLWPENDQNHARANLRQTLFVLNQTPVGAWLVADQERVTLQLDKASCIDVVEFAEKLVSGGIDDLNRVGTLYHGDFLSSFYLTDSQPFEEWATLQREKYRRQALEALETLVERHLAGADYAAAEGIAQRQLEIDDLSETAWRALMEALARDGRRTDALTVYERCRQSLQDKLGVEPDAVTTALYRRIRSGEFDTVGLGAAAGQNLRGHETASDPRLELRIQPPSFLSPSTAPQAAEHPVFVARQQELTRLDELLATALKGKGCVVFLTGGPGRGKTALMNAFAQRAMKAHPDLLVVSGTCNAYCGPGNPYLPFRQALEMLTGDVEDRWAAGTMSTDHARRLWAALPYAAQALQEVGAALIDAVLPGRPSVARAVACGGGDTAWVRGLARAVELRAGSGAASDITQTDLYEQYTRLLQDVARRAPLLITLDDVQWADAASVGLLFHLGRRVAESRITLLCAFRPEEIALGRDGERHPLERFINELRRLHGDIVVDLAQDDPVTGRAFVDALIDSEPNRLGDSFRQALAAHTGGHPLFTVELLRMLQDRGGLIQGRDGCWTEGPALAWDAVPARVEAVIEERVGRLETELRETLSVASVEGEDFTAQVISRIRDIDERRLLRQLSQELQKRHRLVREQGEVNAGGLRLLRYRFAHNLFQRYLYNDLSAGERRLLHGEVARALEELHARDREPAVVRLAYHYRLAQEPEKALSYLTQAGHQARRGQAYEDAIAYYRSAIEQLAQVPFAGREMTQERHTLTAELREGLGDVLALTGQHNQARSAYEDALADVPGHDPIWQARLERKVGNTWDTQRLLQNALAAYRRAETTLASDPGGDTADHWHEWLEVQLSLVNLHYLCVNADEMVETLEKIRTAVEQHGTQDQQIRFLHNRNLAGTLRDRFVPSEGTLSLSRTALALRQQSGNPSSIAHGQFNLAFNLLCRGAIDEAEEHLQRVLEFGARTGDAWLETASLAYLTVVNRKRGQVTEAKRYAERTLQAARVSLLDWYIAMAQANLAWVAWHDGDPFDAQERARTALEIWKRLGAISPWQWTALWPLISLAISRDDLPGAIDHASALLDPEQQRLPHDLAVHLEGAVQGFEAGDKTAARNYLKQAIELAQDLGYL